MSAFRFKQFSVTQNVNAMKVGTDAMVLGAHVTGDKVNHILDMGAGTGVISLMLAQRFTNAQVTAVELDVSSSIECRSNFNASNWSRRLHVVQDDVRAYSSDQPFDLIVSNPPYYQTENVNQDQRLATAKHGSRELISDWLKKAAELLSDTGQLWLIVPAEDRLIWVKEALIHSLHLSTEIAVMGKQGDPAKRAILVFGCTEQNVMHNEFIIRNPDGSYSDEYIDLTIDYHNIDLRKEP